MTNKDQRPGTSDRLQPQDLLSHWRVARWLGYEDQLLRYMSELHPDDLDALYEQVEEKYISFTVQIAELSAQDVLTLIQAPALRNALPGGDAIAKACADPTTFDLLAKDLNVSFEIFKALQQDPSETHMAKGTRRHREPTVRHFLGQLHVHLSRLDDASVQSALRRVRAEAGDKTVAGVNELSLADWHCAKACLTGAWSLAQVASDELPGEDGSASKPRQWSKA